MRERGLPAWIAKALTLALLAPGAGLAQSEVGTVADRQREILGTIDRQEAEHGTLADELVDPLTELALFYQEHGDYAPAAVAIERARQVIRVNRGLHTMDEALLIRMLIDSERALGNAAAEWDLEQQLLAMIRRNPDDPRTPSLLGEIAARRIDVLNRFIDGEFPPEIVLGCYFKDRGQRFNPYRTPISDSCQSGSQGTVVHAIRRESWEYYDEAIWLLVERGQLSSPTLRELEMDLVLSSYRFGDYPLGRESLRRLFAYETASAQPLPTRMLALTRMADWDLLFAWRNFWAVDAEPALDVYRHAYAKLERADTDPASLDAFFRPDVPVMIPDFLPNPLVTRASGSTGYIDVAFDIAPNGESENIEILDRAENATRADARGLERLIDDSRFRPQSADGLFDESTRVTVRYYLSD